MEQNQYNRQYFQNRKTDPEFVKKRTAYSVNYLNTHPEKRLMYQRRYQLKKKYGITLEEYDNILQQQDGKCAVCGQNNSHSKGYLFAVDHDHKTGTVRGLLCHNCNMAIGLLKDDVQIIKSMLQYLEKN